MLFFLGKFLTNLVKISYCRLPFPWQPYASVAKYFDHQDSESNILRRYAGSYLVSTVDNYQKSGDKWVNYFLYSWFTVSMHGNHLHDLCRKSTPTLHLSLLFGMKILKEIIIDETLPKNYKIPEFLSDVTCYHRNCCHGFLPHHVHWIASFWKADSNRYILSYDTCCYLVLPLNYAYNSLGI